MNSLKRVSCFVIVAVMLFTMFIGTTLTSSAATPLAHKVQLDTEWKSVYVGGASLYKTGCGIFSLSNAVGYLTGKRIDITSAAKWAHSIGGFNVSGGDGTYRLVLYPKVQAKYGATYGFTLNCNGGQGWWQGSSSSVLKKHLSSGGVAIGHVPGHFIALVDYDYNTNKFHVLDSAPSTARGTTSGRGDCWVTQSRLATGKLKLDWFCLLSATGTPADEQDNEKGLLATAIANAEDKRYDQYTESGIASLRSAYNNAVSVYNNANSASADYKAARTTLETAMKGATSSIISLGKSYTMTKKWTSYDTAVDDGKKLTDGDKGNADGGCGKFSASKTDNGVGTEIVIDLGSVQNSNIYKIYMAAGADGIATPWGDQLALDVKVSNDGVNFTHVVSAANSVRTGIKAGNWETLTLTASVDTAVSARYVKFTVISHAANNFVWLDEVEVINGEPVLSGNVYVNGMNQKIGSGDCFVFTSKFGTITTDTANHAWTANIVAKWVEGNKYQVTSKTFGNGASTPSITLAQDEILIAANNWETGVTDGSAVKGSAANTNTLNSVQLGDFLYVDGIDSYNSKLDVVAYVKVAAASTEAPAPEAHQHTPGPVSCTSDQVCLTCGDVLATAKGHDQGEWVTEENIKHLMCTACGEVLKTEEIEIDGVGEEKPGEEEPEKPIVPDNDDKPAKEKIGLYGDVNMNEKIDMTDYILVKRAYFGTYTLNEAEVILADINVNDKIDMTDYILLKRMYFGTYELANPIAYK